MENFWNLVTYFEGKKSKILGTIAILVSFALVNGWVSQQVAGLIQAIAGVWGWGFAIATNKMYTREFNNFQDKIKKEEDKNYKKYFQKPKKNKI